MSLKKHLIFEINNITNIINKLIDKYDGYGVTRCEINQGECMNFANDLYELLKEKGFKDIKLLDDAHFYDPFDQGDEYLLDPSEYGTVPDNFPDKEPPTHHWVFFDGKHYDAEAPEGVEDMFELPIFKRWY